MGTEPFDRAEFAVYHRDAEYICEIKLYVSTRGTRASVNQFTRKTLVCKTTAQIQITQRGVVLVLLLILYKEREGVLSQFTKHSKKL
jgi:hypothetical protein